MAVEFMEMWIVTGGMAYNLDRERVNHTDNTTYR